MMQSTHYLRVIRKKQPWYSSIPENLDRFRINYGKSQEELTHLHLKEGFIPMFELNGKCKLPYNCGIYMIKGSILRDNDIFEKYYIGRSDNLLSRWLSHTSLLKEGEHTNKDLQSFYNKCGSTAISFYWILAVKDIKLLRYYEKLEIAQYHPSLLMNKHLHQNYKKPINIQSDIYKRLLDYKLLHNLNSIEAVIIKLLDQR